KRHLFIRLKVRSPRISPAHETRPVTKEEVCQRRTGIVWTNAVVIAGNETAVSSSVLVISFSAAVASAVVVTVLTNTKVAANLVRRISFHDSDCIGNVKVIREKIEWTTITSELRSPILP